MPFELKTPTNVRLTNLVCRVEAAGKKKDVPAVTLRLKLEGVENTFLDMLSPTIRLTAYAPVEGQEQLPGMPVVTPVLRSKDWKQWKPEELCYQGWKVHIDHGIDESDPIRMDKCKVDGFECDFYEGGRVDIEFKVSTSDIDSDGVGVLWASQKQVFPVTIIAPELPAGDRTEATGAEIDGTKGHPGAADGQGSLLDGDAVTPESALAGSLGDPDGQDVDPDDDDSDHDAPPDTEGGATDAADGAEELEAGMRASLEAAGVQPKGARRGRRAAASVE